MYTLRRTETFDAWLKGLRDPRGKARILARLRSVEAGNLGDIKAVGDGVSELRLHTGPGYRVYLTRVGTVVFVLLCGGDKSSQARDIKTAKALAADLKEG